MQHTSIHPDTTVENVHLTVSDLSRSLPFYQEALGLALHRREGNTAYLGGHAAMNGSTKTEPTPHAGDTNPTSLLVLHEKRDAKRPRRATGLYHFAILVPSRLELARSLRHLAETETPLQGFADHLVSEAIYLADPDGNGIEIYRDRPRSQWVGAQGRIQMGTDPLDIQSVLGELKGDESEWRGLDPATVLGHMHLQVADLRAAEEFYRDVIGFDVMVNLGSASFLSAGGYHHHLGINTWGTAGAPPPPPDSIGLRFYTIQLPNLPELSSVAERAQKAGVQLEETDEGLLVRDPSQNALVLSVADK
jgi:catechol 2,3-dioxygenase